MATAQENMTANKTMTAKMMRAARKAARRSTGGVGNSLLLSPVHRSWLRPAGGRDQVGFATWEELGVALAQGIKVE